MSDHKPYVVTWTIEIEATSPEAAAELARALDIVKASDGLEFAQAKVDEYLAKARAVLPASLPADVREAYIMAADFIGGRKF